MVTESGPQSWVGSGKLPEQGDLDSMIAQVKRCFLWSELPNCGPGWLVKKTQCLEVCKHRLEQSRMTGQRDYMSPRIPR